MNQLTPVTPPKQSTRLEIIDLQVGGHFDDLMRLAARVASLADRLVGFRRRLPSKAPTPPLSAATLLEKSKTNVAAARRAGIAIGDQLERLEQL